jgi:hypothetical protein
MIPRRLRFTGPIAPSNLQRMCGLRVSPRRGRSLVRRSPCSAPAALPSKAEGYKPGGPKTEMLALKTRSRSGTLLDVIHQLWRPLATRAIAMPFRVELCRDRRYGQPLTLTRLPPKLPNVLD